MTKWDGQLLQIATAFFLLQSATRFIKNWTGITKCDGFITNCDSTRLEFTQILFKK